MSGSFKLSVVGWMLLVAGVTQAQNLPPSLVQATQTAVQSSPDVQEKWKAFVGSQQLKPQARAAWLPQVDAQAYVGEQEKQSPGSNTNSFSTHGAGLSLTQLLFDAGVASSAIRGAGQQQLQSYYEFTETSEAVALAVFKAYTDVLRSQELVQVATVNYAEHKSTVNQLAERVRATVSRRVDLEQATARLAQAENALVDATTAQHNARTHYLRMVGVVPPATLAAWPEGVALAGVPASAQDTLAQGVRANPALWAALSGWRAAEETLQGRKAAFYPKLQARAGVSQDENLDGVSGQHDKQWAELALNHNFYRGGADSAAQDRAQELVARAQARFDQTCREVQNNLSVAFKDVDTLAVQARLRAAHRLATEKAQQAYRDQFDIGQRTLLDLLDTQNEYFAAQQSYTHARYDQLQAQARTLAGMGRLVATVGAQRADMPSAADAGQDAERGDPGQFCQPQTTFMDSLERIKAELEPARPRNYVVLLPDTDGKVGKVIVSGAAGQQEVDKARYAVPLTGATAAQAVSAKAVDKDFGASLQAQPPAPTQFTLFFGLGSTQLSAAGRKEWQRLLAYIKTRPTFDITVAGYTDTVGTDVVNDALSRKRAEAIVALLRKSGYQDVAVTVEAYGARSLLVPTPPQTKEERNRRVSITVR